MSYTRRITVMLAGLAGGALALGAAASPALAVPPPPKPGGTTVIPQPAIHTVVIGGMPGWQITLIAAGPRCSPPRWRCSPTIGGPRGGCARPPDP